MCTYHAVAPEVVVKCALAAELLLDTRIIRAAISGLDNVEQRELFYELLQEITRTHRALTSWLIGRHAESPNVAEIVETYRDLYYQLLSKQAACLNMEDQGPYLKRFEYYRGLGLPEFAAQSLTVFPNVLLLFELLSSVKTSGLDLIPVAALFWEVLQALNLKGLLDLDRKLEPSNKWENELRVTAFQSIRHSISAITLEFLRRETRASEIRAMLQKLGAYGQFLDVVHEICEASAGIAAVAVVARQLQALSAKV
jgi:NAD-specific glutamate dehydrogenase